MPTFAASKSARIAASFSASIGGRPSAFPCALARSNPDLTRSRIIARGNDDNLWINRFNRGRREGHPIEPIALTRVWTRP
jgi:hypothetical protein